VPNSELSDFHKGMKKDTFDAYALGDISPGLLVGSAFFILDGRQSVLQQYYYPTYEDRTRMQTVVASLFLD
jgi:hypothetical protein